MKKTIFLILLLPLFSFSQKDSTLLRDKFYLEINGGLGQFHFSDTYQGNPSNNPELLKYRSLLANFELNVNYRNNYLKTGATLLSWKIFDGWLNGSIAYTLGGNLLAFSKITNNYFGPYLTYGRIRNELFSPRYAYFSFGMDVYLRKFHIDFYYSKIVNIQTIPDYENTYMYGFNIGYAFNLESFRKKK